MEAAGFLPGICQLLSILADGLPHNTVAFVNLYDSIIHSLNEPDEHSLPNIHQLFDRITNIENNIQRIRIMNPNSRRPPLPNSTVTVSPTQPLITAPVGTATVTPQSTHSAPRCSNCQCTGHTDATCFQPGGAMEGRWEEYLASRIPKPIAHIAEVEEI